MELARDLRFAARLYWKDRWFTAMVITALALGLGANAAVFTIVNAAVLRSLPLPSPDQVMFVGTRSAEGGIAGVSLRDFEDWDAATRTLSGLSFVFNGSFPVGNEGLFPDLVPGAYVSADLFRTLGVPPTMGRDFVDDEDTPGAPLVVMISHALWSSRYSRDAAIVGRPIRIVDTPGTIIGVMPEGMHFPFDADVWLPIGTMPATFANAPRQARGYFAVGRVADGITLEQSREELRSIGARLAEQYPETNANLWPHPDPFVDRFLGSQFRRLLWALLGAAAFVLLIAGSNAANLLLARAARRSGEMSVRVAVGASRWQVVRQLLIESLLLSGLAGGLGLLLAIAGVRWFAAESPNMNLPYWITFTMDWRAFAFLFGLCLATGVVFGLAPALHAARTNVYEMLKEGGRSGSTGVRAQRWTSGLMVGQIALTLVLLTGAGLMLRSVLTLSGTDVGFDPARIVASNMVIPARKYPTPEDTVRMLQNIDAHFATVAAVEVSTTTALPSLGGGVRPLEVEGRPTNEEQPDFVTVLSVGPRYFEAMGTPLLRGRRFSAFDGEPGRLSAIVNQQLVDLYFGGRDPIGHRVRLGRTFAGVRDTEWATVVGLAPNIRQRLDNMNPDPDPVAYIPHRQNTIGRTANVVARARGSADPVQASRLLREGMMVVDPDQALSSPRTMEDAVGQQRWPLRVFGTMFSLFSLIALVLSAVGLYAMTACAVSQRTRDIGVRMVLGARPRQIVWTVLRRSLVQLLVGVGLGLAAALALGQVVQALLVQTSPRDPVTLTAIVVLLAAVAIVACLAPARRAAQLDPLAAVRHE